ncbi:MAG: FAD-dependent oxidoreductase [Desulfurococcaceae archaeon]
MPSDLRIIEHPILDFKRTRKISFFFENQVIEAYEGESILAALYAAGVRIFSFSENGVGRGLFCSIGRCSSCLAYVNKVPNVRICIEPVRNGIRVERQRGFPNLPLDTNVNYVRTERVKTDVLIIGAGPAGLKATLTLAELGFDVTLVNDHYKLGGQLVKQTHKFFGDKMYYGGIRGFKIAEKLVGEISKFSNVHVYTNAQAYGFFDENIIGVAVRGCDEKNLLVKPRAVVVATGAVEKSLLFENNDLPGVMGAGAAQTLMNEYGVKPGDKAVVIGSGNVGLIISYQLIQAGVNVEAIAEIMPSIGGWFVHAAKVRRLGVPILTKHTILRAEGTDRVERAVLSAVDNNFQPITGSEKVFNVDLILIAVGLQPNYSLLYQAGAVCKYVAELGGFTPIRTWGMETSVPNVFVAGDASGIEEATTAFIEGEIAALTIAMKLGFDSNSISRRRSELMDFLWNEYRLAPVVERSRIGKLKVTVSEEEMEKIRKGVLY